MASENRKFYEAFNNNGQLIQVKKRFGYMREITLKMYDNGRLWVHLNDNHGRHGIQRQSLQGTFMVNNSVLTLRKNVSQRLISSELFLKYIKRIGCIISSFSLVQNVYLVPKKTLDHTKEQFLHPHSRQRQLIKTVFFFSFLTI